MWAANLQQVFKTNPKGKPYDCWVLFLKLNSETQIEKAIQTKHEEIDTILADQNVNYSEITTPKGKHFVYDKFNSQTGKHPLFLVLNKHPLQYVKGDPLMVIEWGKWTDVETLKDDLMALVNFFSNENFRKQIIEAKNPTMWKKARNTLEAHGISLLNIGANIALAL